MKDSMEHNGDEVITFKFTVRRALELGLLRCECGCPPNKHFDHGDNPCAGCRDCKKYKRRHYPVQT